MLKKLVVSASVFCAVVLTTSGLALGQAVVGPGDQTGSAGAETEFAFSLNRGGANVAIFGFNIVVSTALGAVLEPVLKEGGQPGEIDCAVESDIDANVDALVFLIEGDEGEDDIIAVSFGDLAFPLTNISRDGVIGRCKFRVVTGTEPQTVALPCDTSAGATSASDADGTAIDITCEDGELVIAPPPTSTPTNTTVPPTDTPEPTNTTVPTNTQGPGGGEPDDDGCNISSQGGSNMSWLLLAPIAALIVRRRRAK